MKLLRTTRARRGPLPGAAPPLFCLGLLLLSSGALPAGGAPPVGPREDHRGAAARLRRLIEHEMKDKALPALSIALVDGQETVWAEGFGLADPEEKAPAGAETIYRVGSVSKLFTAIALLRLVEAGRLSLDAPLSEVLPELHPRNPFGKPITLRQLLSHRSGLVREPPRGSYFDLAPPSLAETVRSLNDTTLVYLPGSRAKYSNAGLTAAGLVLERVEGRPFRECVREGVLRPLGLERSDFQATAEVRRLLARAVMWTRDGRVFPAPTFELGIAPAGSLYSSVLDLGRFLSALLAGGNAAGGRAAGDRAASGQVLRRETLETMWTPQLVEPDRLPAFGLGFLVSRFEGRRRVGHGGAVYGFATELAALPDDRLGVVVAASKDLASSAVRRIADEALRAMLAVREGKEMAPLDLSAPVDPALARRLAGRYRGAGMSVDLLEREGKLFFARDGLPSALRALGGDLVVDDPVSFGPRLTPLEGGSIVLEGALLERVEAPRPAPPPERWAGLIGEYGWNHNTLYVLEREGRLHALIEWFFLYALEELSPDVFAFPQEGLYAGEKLVFSRGGGGAAGVEAAGVVFSRRPVGAASGETFRIRPLKPIEELRRAALAASPPGERGDFEKSDLVDLSGLDPGIKLDLRYATTNNFLGSVLYERPRALLQRPAAEALLAAHRSLAPRGYGLLVHDAYRPWHVTRMFWDATPEEMRIFVADPARGSRHNRAAAVDLTLYELSTGRPAPMVSGYDEFSPRAYPDYPGGSSLERWHRDLLRQVMEAQGFTVYSFEWWHFDFRGWERFPILNLPLSEARPGR